jgi:hypothetical protein
MLLEEEEPIIAAASQLPCLQAGGRQEQHQELLFLSQERADGTGRDGTGWDRTVRTPPDHDPYVVQSEGSRIDCYTHALNELSCTTTRRGSMPPLFGGVGSG